MYYWSSDHVAKLMEVAVSGSPEDGDRKKFGIIRLVFGRLQSLND